MKTIKDIIIANNPERYFIRYTENSGKKRILCLQIEDDFCYLTDSADVNRSKSKCIEYYTGLIEDFCLDFGAIQYGILLPDIALLKWFNKNLLPYC